MRITVNSVGKQFLELTLAAYIRSIGIYLQENPHIRHMMGIDLQKLFEPIKINGTKDKTLLRRPRQGV